MSKHKKYFGSDLRPIPLVKPLEEMVKEINEIEKGDIAQSSLAIDGEVIYEHKESKKENTMTNQTNTNTNTNINVMDQVKALADKPEDLLAFLKVASNLPGVSAEEKAAMELMIKLAENSVTEKAKETSKEVKETLPSGSDTIGWGSTIAAGVTAVVTTGFDILTEGDISTARLVGTAAAGIAAGAIQRGVEHYFEDDLKKSTGLRYGVAVGVGAGVGTGARFAVNYFDRPTEMIEE